MKIIKQRSSFEVLYLFFFLVFKLGEVISKKDLVINKKCTFKRAVTT